MAAMKNPATAPWNLDISHNDIEKLLRGFKPTAMEDRWVCRADQERDARGHFVVHVYRSWTGDELFRINVGLAVHDGNASSALTDERQAKIIDITWDSQELFLATESEAKNLATNVCRNVLGCDL